MLLLLLTGGAAAQVQLPSLIGTWCPVEGSHALYSVTDETHEIEQLAVSAWRTSDGQAWRVRLAYFGLDSHVIEETLNARGLRSVSCGEPGLSLRPISSYLWEGGGKPLEIRTVATLRGSETVLTEAGPFACQVYQGGQGKDAFQVWINPQISPYGLVRYKGGPTEFRLARYRVEPSQKKEGP